MKPETAASAIRSLGLGRPDSALSASMRHSAGLVQPSLPAYQLGMAKRVKSLTQERGTILFDVVFADGSCASNRRVPMEILGGLDGDQPARDLIEQQEARSPRRLVGRCE